MSAKGRLAATKARKVSADEYAERVFPIISAFKAAGKSLRGIAQELNNSRITTPRQKQWTAGAVRNAIIRAAQARA